MLFDLDSRISAPALYECLPLVQLKVSAYCHKGVTSWFVFGKAARLPMYWVSWKLTPPAAAPNCGTTRIPFDVGTNARAASLNAGVSNGESVLVPVTR